MGQTDVYLRAEFLIACGSTNGTNLTFAKDPSEDVVSHIAQMQRNFSDLNQELKRLVKTQLPDLLLMSKIMSTLPTEYFEFKSMCGCVCVQERAINQFSERLRHPEMRLPG